MRRCQYYTWPCCVDYKVCEEPAVASLTNLRADDPENPLSEKTFWYCSSHYDELARRGLESADNPDHPYQRSHVDWCVLNGLKNNFR